MKTITQDKTKEYLKKQRKLKQTLKRIYQEINKNQKQLLN